MTETGLPPGHYAHADAHVDSVIRDLVVNHRCEVSPVNPSGWFHIDCGCPKRHFTTVEVNLGDVPGQVVAADLRKVFDCC